MRRYEPISISNSSILVVCRLIYCKTKESKMDYHILVKSIGMVCVYCGKLYYGEYTRVCCGEVHYEEGYETVEGEIILHSELTSQHEIQE